MTERGMSVRGFAWPLAVTAVLAKGAEPLVAQTAAPLELQRLSGPVEIDGRLDEAAWRALPALPLTMYAPTFRGAPTQRTEIRVGYDDESFYAAGWFYDSDPDGIRINSLYRDRWNGDDAFAIYIDAFNDNQNSKWFGTTPAGIRFDILVTDDGATQNDSWDTFWAAETTVTPEGWFAEVRIPFSSLGFQVDASGRAEMGLTLTRLVSRLGERVTFPEIDPAFEFRRPSVARDVVLHDVRSHTPFYVTPYALTGVQRHAVLPAEAPAWVQDDRTSREVGLDVRYPITSNLTLDVTANTDFAQVEADEQQVNLDRFPLFFPERRRFFQEGSGIFDFAMGGNSRLFHSRRIGLTDAQLPVPVLGGGRLVGRMGQWDVGLLNMQTEEVKTADVVTLPTENYGVLRLRRPVLNENSTAGMMLTSRLSEGHHNLGIGTDASIRVFGDTYLGLKWAGTFDDTDAGGVTLADRSQFDVRWERRALRGLAYTLSSARAGPDFDPRVGYLQRRDFTTANAVGNYYIYTDAHPYFRRIYPGALAFSTFRNSDGALESAQYAVWVQWDTKAGGGGWIEPKVFHENVLFPFVIGGEAEIPVGSYDYADLQLVFTMPSGARLRTQIDFRAGTFYDGTRVQAILRPTWNVAPQLEVGGEYQISRLRFDERGQKADVHLARLRIRSALNARASGNAIIQYNSSDDRLDFNVRLRYAFAEGTDLWLVYNEGLATVLETDTPGLDRPRSLARSLIVKYTHTFGF